MNIPRCLPPGLREKGVPGFVNGQKKYSNRFEPAVVQNYDNRNGFIDSASLPSKDLMYPPHVCCSPWKAPGHIFVVVEFMKPIPAEIASLFEYIPNKLVMSL